ncbi:MAG: fumarylacetoacetate hydrolase family protein [Clostridia bacterium]|nr:fumarylacetoacetate hydrolase family protein [Clostridia bacterium]
MFSVRNIYCVGRNYALHAQELKNEIPKSPFLFTKPTHAVVEAKGQVITLPGNRGSVHYETELVIHIGDAYKKGISVDQIVDKMAIGIDFTLRDVQNDLKKKGYPWLLAKGFPNSAVLSRFIDFTGVEECKKTNFALKINGNQVQVGNIKDLIFDLQTIIDFTADNFGLAKDDIIFTGTPQGVGPVSNGDHMSLLFNEQVLGDCIINLL